MTTLYLILVIYFIIYSLFLRKCEDSGKDHNHIAFAVFGILIPIVIYLVMMHLHPQEVLIHQLASFFNLEIATFETFVKYVLLLIIIMEPCAYSIKLVIFQDVEDAPDNKLSELIGVFERGTVALLAINNSYDAIGFVVAAKSIARTTKFSLTGSKDFSSIFLVGTLASIFEAILVANILF